MKFLEDTFILEKDNREKTLKELISFCNKNNIEIKGIRDLKNEKLF